MMKESSTFSIMAFVFTSLANQLLLSHLATLHVPTSFTLTIRGAACLIVTLLVASIANEQIKILHYPTQWARFVFSAFGLWAGIESYQHARMTEISFISRLDIALLVLFGTAVGLHTKRSQKLIAIVLVGTLFAAISVFSDESTQAWGLGLALISTTLISSSYLLLSRTAKLESPTIVPLTPAIACISLGSILMLNADQLPAPSIYQLSLMALSGTLMFASYRTTRTLYRRFDFLPAQSIFLVIPIISIPLDIWRLDKAFRLEEYFIFVAISAIAFAACHFDGFESKVKEKTPNGLKNFTA